MMAVMGKVAPVTPASTLFSARVSTLKTVFSYLHFVSALQMRRLKCIVIRFCCQASASIDITDIIIRNFCRLKFALGRY